MRQVRLLSVGEVEHSSKQSDHGLASLDRPAMLVYTGKFDSMDGPVEITDQHISKLVKNHNKSLSQLKKLSKDGEIQPKNYPPIQLDHSASATATVGRLVGDLHEGPAKVEGKAVKALFGNVRILGKENVEKVLDGRWTHLSIGADLDACKINELTITPFPAAAKASLLKKGNRMAEFDSMEYKGCLIHVQKDEVGSFSAIISDPSGQSYVSEHLFTSSDLAKDHAIQHIESKTYLNLPKGKSSFVPPGTSAPKSDAQVTDVEGDEPKGQPVSMGKPMKEVIKDEEFYGAKYKIVKVSPDDMHKQEYFKVEGIKGITAEFPSAVEAQAAAERAIKRDSVYGKPTKMSKGDDMDKEKLKKHLVEKEKLSEKEADEKLAGMDDEQMAKMAAEVDEKEKKLAKEEDEDKEAKMSAARENVAKLTAGFKKNVSNARFAQKKMSLSVRLSKLKAQAKITPAEIKKINIDTLAARSEEAIESFFDAYKNRENVVPVGVMGTTKAMTAAQIAQLSKKKEGDALMNESIQNMPFLKNVLLKEGTKGGVQLSDAEDMPNRTVGGEGGGAVVEGDDSPAHSMLKHLENAHAAIDEGKHEEAKAHLKLCMEKMKAHLEGGVEGVPVHDEAGSEKRMSALAESVKKMESQFDELVSLVEPVLGIST